MTSALAGVRKILAHVGPTERVAVFVSGGKDSIVTLDLCVRAFGRGRVEGVLMELVPGLDIEWRAVRVLERRFGVKVHGVPHWTRSHLLKESAFRPYVEGSEKIRALKLPDIERYAMAKLNCQWVASGAKAADSTNRNAQLKRVGGVEKASRRLYPIAWFKKADVYGYLRARKLPIPAMVGGKKQMGGISVTAECLRWLEKHSPTDLQKLYNDFPFASALLTREDLLAREAAAKAANGAQARATET